MTAVTILRDAQWKRVKNRNYPDGMDLKGLATYVTVCKNMFYHVDLAYVPKST